MIVSHKHRFIFLKTRKTAGTSIEIVLSGIAGDDAVVTPLYPPEQAHEPRNHGVDASGDHPTSSLTYEYLKANPQHCRYVPYLTHMPAWMVREKIGHNVWNDYFKFCFERNPWDKVVSKYWWRNRETERIPPFNDWLVSAPSVTSDWSIYTIDDRLAVDAVGRYERLSTDLNEILGRLGIASGGFSLPQAKSGVRRQHGLYSHAGAQYVRRVFRREVELFGYDCPPSMMM